MDEKAGKLPECWQALEDTLNAGIDRVILFGPSGIGKTYAGLTTSTPTVARPLFKVLPLAMLRQVRSDWSAQRT